MRFDKRVVKQFFEQCEPLDVFSKLYEMHSPFLGIRNKCFSIGANKSILIDLNYFNVYHIGRCGIHSNIVRNRTVWFVYKADSVAPKINSINKYVFIIGTINTSIDTILFAIEVYLEITVRIKLNKFNFEIQTTVMSLD